MSNGSLVQIDNLTIGYRTKQGYTPVVRSVSLQIAAGEAFGLVGESGCGKSTLCMALLAYLRNGSRVLGGQVLFDHIDIFQLDNTALEHLRGRRIAFVPQNASQALTPTMRIGTQAMESLILHHGMSKLHAQQQIENILYRMQLPQPEQLMQRYPHQLSGGQQQRVMIAMALSSQPDLLILDEPTTGLDVTTQAHILDLLRMITHENNTTLFCVSHDLDAMARVSDRVGVMYAGEMVEIAPIDTLFKSPAHPYSLGLLLSIPHVSQAELHPPIPGQPVEPDADRQACAFAPRCTLSSPKCYDQSPNFTSVNPAHQVRCHHWQKLRAIVNHTESNKIYPIYSNNEKYRSVPLLMLHNVSIAYTRQSWLERVKHIPTVLDAVQNVSLEIYRGETLALVGESGSGKTTLLRSIVGLKTPHTGQITFSKFDITTSVDRRPREVCRAIQIIFQNPDASLNPRQTIANILEKPLRLYFNLNSVQCREFSRKLLEQVQLAPHYLERFPSQLSGGEKQRVAIVRAFAAEPELVLCDEITSALDVSTQSVVLNILKNLQVQRKLACLFVTHNLALVHAIADRVAVLYQGQLCEINSVGYLNKAPWHPYTETLIKTDSAFQGKITPQVFAPDIIYVPPTKGCPYQRSCSHHIGPICDEKDPPWQVASRDHRIRCHIAPRDLSLTQMTATTKAVSD